MKKYITLLALATIITPSIALAVWWNPFSWFNHWTFYKKEVVVPIVEITQNDNTKEDNTLEENNTSKEVEDLKKEIEELKKIQTNTETVKKINDVPIQKTVNQPIVNTVDICSNIEGVQTQLAENYSVNQGICTEMKDFCLNIEGFQAELPENMIYDRGLNKCLTKAEKEEIEKQKERQVLCERKKEELINLKKEYMEQVEYYTQKIEDFRNNFGGTTSGLMQAIQLVYTERNVALTKINNQISIVESEISLYCDN